MMTDNNCGVVCRSDNVEENVYFIMDTVENGRLINREHKMAARPFCSKRLVAA